MTNHGQLPQLSSITTQLYTLLICQAMFLIRIRQLYRETGKIEHSSQRHIQKINYSAAAVKRWQFKVNGVILIVTC